MKAHDTPVAYFFFNRPLFTAQSFAAIKALKPRRLLLISDGPRTEDDAASCAAAREIAERIDWSCDVERNYSATNLGCRRRFTSGLSWVFEQTAAAIVLEDDCVPHPDFFPFCSELLERYRTATDIMMISGNNFQQGATRGEGSYFFSKYFHIWGWASWRRAWQQYEPDVTSWPETSKLEEFNSCFDSEQEQQYWHGIFERCYREELNTWDYQWIYSCWRHRGLCIQPAHNLVTNIGCDPNLSQLPHGQLVNNVAVNELGVLRHPAQVVRSKEADEFTFRKLFAPGAAALPDNDFLSRLRRLLPLARSLPPKQC